MIRILGIQLRIDLHLLAREYCGRIIEVIEQAGVCPPDREVVRNAEGRRDGAEESVDGLFGGRYLGGGVPCGAEEQSVGDKFAVELPSVSVSCKCVYFIVSSLLFSCL